ncbi:uncharacterized protein OCT59_002356 [Rhizophagus irregularis]|uniref:RING-type domain-containing protein n=2 Tax=Rhizophagus irregularis TaxID=588596 RepID=A0A2H5TWR6_RHIID|nr:hypothetical protein GLOIN_2v1486643 [Rhizophagus irregularis DAOM 181602=DAOM 197198]PKY25670.1 hypothetical protein RhiirB3_440702 [Rhizophagus irregularis]POG60924.1 hypothetical protein GLOIN_2v1486643 [Rhizophagus irregularis DAOM 181602=DAOM 197198]UZO10778.1 hypothetical protein OCT59_002356 [Rhizophagus irregularis]CAB4492069.1 unnamed protein product [Rhizophagus irregularis]GBC46960.1 hypothetical protein GLOIN_2v1486643 [Rhizophagus irregularis DAOM 181602=DAOM 197198]|eukprot:XP_025167790.1 hypothetical protein GLOIN_2v1486643 [Rhizophagus irregularis DAOM 181602=DAOM 197198]
MAPNNLKILAYNILKSLGDDLVKDMKIPELGPCSECNNEILSLNLRPFTTLSCGHTYHRLCIENKILHNAASVCSFPGCGKTIETEAVDTRRDYDSSQSSGTSTITSMLGSGLSLNPLPVKQDRGSNEEEIVTRAINQPTPSSRKRKNNSTSVNNPSKRVKKPVKNEDSRMLKRLVREMSTVSPRTSDLKEREALERASKLGSGKNVFFDLYFQICNGRGCSFRSDNKLPIFWRGTRKTSRPV